MTQEQKDILLKDLSARLPYGVKGLVTFHKNMTETREEVRILGGKLYDRFAKFQDSWYDNVTIKPYLFPLSSMTEEQRKEYNSLRSIGVDECGDITCFDTFESVDWCNKNHFDYRGLIPMGLAIDATNLNIY